LAEILLIVSGNTHDQNQQQHLSSSASSEQLSLLPMFQTAYDDMKIEEEQLGRETQIITEERIHYIDD
jgi:hypothetical protein